MVKKIEDEKMKRIKAMKMGIHSIWVPVELAIAGMYWALWLSRVQLFATLWTVALQAPLSMGFFRQEYWSGLPTASLGIFATQESTYISCIGRGFFNHKVTGEVS